MQPQSAQIIKKSYECVSFFILHSFVDLHHETWVLCPDNFSEFFMLLFVFYVLLSHNVVTMLNRCFYMIFHGSNKLKLHNFIIFKFRFTDYLHSSFHLRQDNERYFKLRVWICELLEVFHNNFRVLSKLNVEFLFVTDSLKLHFVAREVEVEVKFVITDEFDFKGFGVLEFPYQENLYDKLFLIGKFLLAFGFLANVNVYFVTALVEQMVTLHEKWVILIELYYFVVPMRSSKHVCYKFFIYFYIQMQIGTISLFFCGEKEGIVLGTFDKQKVKKISTFSLIIYIYQVMLQRKIAQVLGRFSSAPQVPQSLSLMTPSEKESFLRKIEQNAKMEYRVYPYQPHQDPSSPQYIPSELDEYHDKLHVSAYNTVIDNFKNDLKVQREVWEAIENLDRPYKRGIPGVHTNLDPNGVAKPKLEDLGFPRHDPEVDTQFTFANEDRFIANTPFHYGLTFKHIQEWENERRNRPVTRNFNSKGYKYDVEVKNEDKYQYVADRLGHPEFLGTPMQRLLKLENDIYHPTYLDQPFVQMPNVKPSESLNFQHGEVIYENTQVLEWVKFWQLTALVGGGFFTLFIPFNLTFKTNLVTDTADEFMNTPYHLCSPALIDILRVGIPVGTGAIIYVIYILTNFINKALEQYIVKMSYSKDKELVFVKRVNLHGILEEEVYETAHLEILPPYQRSGVADLSSYDDDGLWRVSCLNSQRNFVLYNNTANWNRNLKDQFIQNRLKMWDKSYYGFTRKEAAENERKFREDVEASFNQEALPKN